MSDIWGMIRKMSGNRRNYTILVLSIKKTAVNDIEKAVLLVETLVNVYLKMYLI